MQRNSRSRLTMLLAVAAITAAACSSSSSKKSSETTTSKGSAGSAASTSGGKLVGTFGITAAECAGGAVTKGSYFRMVQSGGTVEAGPFVSNADSGCADKSYSALNAGTDGGLVTGSFQSQPDPPFDATKNGVAAKIVQPVKFFGTAFAVSTNATDPQSNASVTAPTVTAGSGGKLSGDVRAVSVAWNGQQFNQGAPKPDGSHPGDTKDVTGTYDAGSGAYTLGWTSQIVGGPFNGFTGVWHLEGTFAAKP